MFINNNSRFCSLCIRMYHPQTFLEECKYVQEKIKTRNYIDEELKSEYDTDNEEQIQKNANPVVIIMNKFLKSVLTQ